MVRERLFIYLVEGFIGFCFILYALGGILANTSTQDASINIALAAVVFFVGIASFAGIPVLRKSSAKGIKLFMISSFAGTYILDTIFLIHFYRYKIQSRLVKN